jgi:hypothetical protein
MVDLNYVPDQLELTVGSAHNILIYLLKGDGQPEDATGLLRGAFSVKEAKDGTEVLRIESPNVTVSSEGDVITLNMTQSKADALVEGVYVADLAIETNEGWFYTDLFLVKILPAISEKLP